MVNIKPIVIEIANDIKLNRSELSYEMVDQIVLDLTIDNPEYAKALRVNRSTSGIPKTIKLFSFDGDKLKLPRGYGRKLRQRLHEHRLSFEVVDKRLTLPAVDFGSRIQLREYQKPAVEALVKEKQGGVVAGCGSGKTMILLEAMARIRQPALWVCHTYELLNQTVERACQVFDISREEVGIIADGKVSVGNRLTLALIQTLSKTDLTKLTDKFGLVAVDEAHHLAARSFFYPIGQFQAMYRLWASATPERSDGLTEMVFAAGGEIVYTIKQHELPTITPQLVVVETTFDKHYPADQYPKLISDLVSSKERNQTVVQTITAEASGNYSLVLSDRIEHLKTLHEMLRETMPNKSIDLLTGDMSKKSRDEVMKRVKERQVDILLATQLAREGLDIVHLNRLYLTTPKRAPGAVQQEVGRVMRPCLGKKDAVVYDFWDSRSPILKAQFWKRRDVYEKLGIKWKVSNVRRPVR